MHSTDRHIRTHRHHHETVSIVLLRKLHTRSHAGKAKLVVILTHTHTHTHTHHTLDFIPSSVSQISFRTSTTPGIRDSMQ